MQSIIASPDETVKSQLQFGEWTRGGGARPQAPRIQWQRTQRKRKRVPVNFMIFKCLKSLMYFPKLITWHLGTLSRESQQIKGRWQQTRRKPTRWYQKPRMRTSPVCTCWLAKVLRLHLLACIITSLSVCSKISWRFVVDRFFILENIYVPECYFNRLGLGTCGLAPDIRQIKLILCWFIKINWCNQVSV